MLLFMQASDQLDHLGLQHHEQHEGLYERLLLNDIRALPLCASTKHQAPRHAYAGVAGWHLRQRLRRPVCGGAVLRAGGEGGGVMYMLPCLSMTTIGDRPCLGVGV